MDADIIKIEESLTALLQEKFSINNSDEVVNLDSLQLMELAAEIEDRFSITIPLEDVSSIKTVKDAAQLIVTLNNTGA